MFKLSDGPVTVSATFERRKGGPERLAADGALVFEGGVLDGLKLVGFSVWTSAEGEHYVTFPSRSWGSGSERRFFDFLRSAEGNGEGVRRVKDTLVRAFEVWLSRGGQ